MTANGRKRGFSWPAAAVLHLTRQPRVADIEEDELPASYKQSPPAWKSCAVSCFSLKSQPFSGPSTLLRCRAAKAGLPLVP